MTFPLPSHEEYKATQVSPSFAVGLHYDWSVLATKLTLCSVLISIGPQLLIINGKAVKVDGNNLVAADPDPSDVSQQFVLLPSGYAIHFFCCLLVFCLCVVLQKPMAVQT